MLKIATWNVNSIKQREAAAAAWLKQAAPDVLCLQELKCQTEGFPRGTFEDLGYNCAVLGQKSFNGVAILSKHPIDETITALPGDGADEQARYIEAAISLPGGKAIRVASIYAPNGNPAPSPKLDYKLAWLERLKAHAQTLLAYEEALVLAGDYNIIPRAVDVYNPPPGPRTRCTGWSRVRHSGVCCIWASRTRCRPATAAAGNTPSGIIRPAPGRRTWACASTTSCCRLKPWRGLAART